MGLVLNPRHAPVVIPGTSIYKSLQLSTLGQFAAVTQTDNTSGGVPHKEVLLRAEEALTAWERCPFTSTSYT